MILFVKGSKAFDSKKPSEKISIYRSPKIYHLQDILELPSISKWPQNDINLLGMSEDLSSTGDLRMTFDF